MKNELREAASEARLRAYARCSEFRVGAEFAPSLLITTWMVAGLSREFSLAELLPLPKQGIHEVPRGT